MSSSFSLIGRLYSSFICPTIFRVFISITSPDETYASLPSSPLEPRDGPPRPADLKRACLASHVHARKTLRLAKLKPHWQKLRNDLHIRTRVHVDLVGGERASSGQSEWEEQLIGQMLAGRCP